MVSGINRCIELFIVCWKPIVRLDCVLLLVTFVILWCLVTSDQLPKYAMFYMKEEFPAVAPMWILPKDNRSRKSSEP